MDFRSYYNHLLKSREQWTPKAEEARVDYGDMLKALTIPV